jgi:hypothetical protein
MKQSALAWIAATLNRRGAWICLAAVRQVMAPRQ